MERIAVWNTAFLGDCILTLPLLQSLRLAFPRAQIDYYVRKGLAPIFMSHPAISKVYTYDKRGEERGFAHILRKGKELAKRNYSLWISPHTSLRSSYLAWASAAPMRIGYKEAVLGRLCYTHQVGRNFAQMQEAERLLGLLLPLGKLPISPWPEISLPPEACAGAADFFAKLGLEPILGQHPGSLWGSKRWPIAYHSELALKALQCGARVLLFAGPGEEEMSRQIIAALQGRLSKAERSRLHDLSAKLTLPELAAYLGKLKCFVGNDSGPMHLAWPQQVPVVVPFGPTTQNLGFVPRSKGSVVLEKELPCRPCGLHGPQMCPLGHHNCMTLITPELAWAAVEPILWPERAK